MLSASNYTMKISERSITEMREFRHDLKNQIATMRILLEEEKYCRLREYFDTFAASVSAQMDYIDCENKEVGAMLNMEAQKCAVNGLRLECKISVPPNLPFAANDLCSLFTNVIDNAIEACVRLFVSEPIEFTLQTKGDYLVATCRNDLGDADASERRAALSLRSAKNDRQNHGLGHKIVDKIVRRYNGLLDYEVQDTHFLVRMMLDMKYSERR